jgi:TetR/AcrR family transcriptional regulator, cholesterol catabolism regulator
MAARPSIPRTSEAKLQQILRRAAHIFADRGFEGASIRDISRATGISLSGLYYYFESKQKLLFLIQREVFASVLRRLQERLAGIESPEERLRVFIQNHMEYFLTHPAEMKVLAHEDDALEGSYRKDVAAIRRRYYNLAREIFDALPLRDSEPPIDPRVAVLSLYGMMNWVYKWHNPKVDPGARELAESVARIFLHGVIDSAAGTKIKRGSQPLRLDRAGAGD